MTRHAPGSESLSVSVIIPCYNAEKTLGRCLEGLLHQDVFPDEIVIVDNGSTDATREIAEQWGARFKIPFRLEHCERRGAAAARNAGLEVVSGDWLAFTDSDCIPEPDWLATGASILAGCDEDVVALAAPAWGSLEGDATACLLGLTSLSVDQPEQIYSDAGAVGMQGFAAANLWVRRKSMIEVYGFDESLSVSGEDMDLCARLYSIGGRLLYSPHVRVRHIHPSGIGAMCRKMVQYGRAHPVLFARYGQPGIYLDMPILGRLHLPASFRFWCNMASAEKKVFLIILVAVWMHWAIILLPVYLYWTGRFLRKRARTVGGNVGFWQGAWLAVLLVVKSAALNWGRIRGSSHGVWTC